MPRPQHPPVEPFLSLKDAAQLLGATTRYLRDQARKGVIPAHRLGSGVRPRLRFRWSEIVAALRPVSAADVGGRK